MHTESNGRGGVEDMTELNTWCPLIKKNCIGFQCVACFKSKGWIDTNGVWLSCSFFNIAIRKLK